MAYDAEALRRKFDQFLAAFKAYTSKRSTIDFDEAQTARNARLQHVQLGLPADDFGRFRLFSHLHDHLMASLPLYTESEPLVQLYPSTIRHCTAAHLRHLESHSSSTTTIPGYVYGELERTIRRQYLPSLEKLDWYTAHCLEFPYQRQIRCIKATTAAMIDLLYDICQLIRSYAFRIRHLDSLMLLRSGDEVELMDADDTETIAEAANVVLTFYRLRLKRLWLNFTQPWLEVDSPPFPLMPRLTFLQVTVHNEDSYHLMLNRLLRGGRNRLTVLHLRLVYPFLLRLFRILDQLPTLMKLSVECIEDPAYSVGDYEALPMLLKPKWKIDSTQWTNLKMLKPGQQTVKLKVLSLNVPSADIFLNTLCLFFGTTVVKIRIIISETMTLNLEDFTALSILQINFRYMPYFTPFFRGDHIRSTRLTTLTLVNLDPVTCQTLDICGRIFPNLREVNVGGFSQESYQHDELTDDLLVASLQNHLPKVVTFRFTDGYIKCSGKSLNRSIQLMLNRAEQAPGRRVIFQVPVDDNVRQQMPAELKEKIMQSKWFRLI